MSATTPNVPQTNRGLFESKRGRTILENLTAYVFLFPALLIIFVFGIFPVGFAFFVSLYQWRRFPGEYRGMEQYVDALGDAAYVIFFWMAIGAMAFGLLMLRRLWRQMRDEETGTREWRGLAFIPPGIANATAILAIVNWFFVLLPVILNIPQRLRGQQITRDSFVTSFFESFRDPAPLAAANSMWLAVIVALVLSIGAFMLLHASKRGQYLTSTTLAALGFGLGLLLMQLTLFEINLAITAAQDAGESLPIWTHIILISAGVVLLGVAYWTWQRALKADENRRFVLYGFFAVALVCGGYLLIAQIPPALANADRDVLSGFSIIFMYSLGTVPFQLAIGLGLAVLLFQNIQGKSLFRMVYFLPYITPFVATSLIFTLLFSNSPDSPANQLIKAAGGLEQRWLLEPRGLFHLIFGDSIPSWLRGPGLALVVMMIYNTWTYAGYATVIFLAGLGNIPREMYEAAKIDGANGWQLFRNITLPLLSPTTFFLTLVATIGTFQAFTQIWLMRKPGAYQAVDTINIYIFNEISASNPDYAYGSAMAFVLFGVILVLTLTQNRIAGRRVFYG